ncbi:MAG: glutathione peroxidase [bacterium]|jgi:glutathione peroxidase
MKTVKHLFLILLLIPIMGLSQSTSIYDFTVQDIDGNEFSFASLKGKKIMVVNVASKCGLTPQYQQLEEVYEKYGGEDFEIVGFPANNFMNQEPGTNEEIKAFCSLEYGVTFPMMSKISVKGNDMAPIYQWLTDEELNGQSSSKVKWNFQKYLIGEDGTLEHVMNPQVKPDDEKIIAWITE